GDDVNEMITDDNGNIWICSITWSPDYIATSDATQLNIGGITDGYLAQFSPNCELLWASYFGGMASERAMDIESYGSSIYICGTTSSASSIATQNAHQTVIGGGSWDCFLARFNICPNPIVTASGATSFCAGDSVILTVPSSLSYQWMLNGNVIAGATDSFYVALASGNYSVAVNNSACGADTSAQMPVTVNPLPVPVITNVGTTLNTGSFSSYQWNLNGNPISGATSQSYSASQGGPYTVTVTDGNGCVGTSAPISLSVTSVQNNSEGLLVYPNPNNGTFTVKAILQSREKEALLTITDIAGRNLASQNVAIKNGVINSEINTGNDLAPGIYLLKLSTGAKSSVISFVKK
ncbi:MAG TPA: T9SS type A sorting domain-containing protein, partial [Flavipsychrobacter sp.]|nr:T9SS type A sorting domain-containing protein [Flavipsychrobacter sp.]